jgi:hypothetical protein
VPRGGSRTTKKLARLSVATRDEFIAPSSNKSVLPPVVMELLAAKFRLNQPVHLRSSARTLYVGGRNEGHYAGHSRLTAKRLQFVRLNIQR